MKDPSRKNQKLIDENALLKQRIKELEQSESERNRAEEEFKKKESLNYALFEYNPEQAIAVDLEGKIIAVNLAKRMSDDRLPNIGDVMYRDYASSHEINMYSELMECLGSGKLKLFPEQKYRNKFLSVTIAPFPMGAVIISEDITKRKRAEEELRNSEARYKQLFENAPAGIYEVDLTTGRILSVNDALCEYTGYIKDELLTINALDLLTEESQKIFIERMAGYAAGEPVPSSLEYKARSKSGREFWMSINPKYFYKEGIPVRASVVARDITELKQAENALRESENKFRSFAEYSLVGIYLIQDGVLRYVNPKFAEIFGYTVEECLDNMFFRDLVYPDDYFTVKEQVRKRLSGESQSVHYIFRGIKKTGEIIQVEIFGTSILSNGMHTITGTILDITERKRTEDALRESEKKYRLVLEANPDPMIVYDNAGKVIYFNPAFSNLFGWSLEERIGKKMDDFVPDESWPETRIMIDMVIAGKNFYGIETHRLTMEKKIIPVSISGSCYRNQEGNIEASVINLRDTTEIKRAEEESSRLASVIRHSRELINLATPNGKMFFLNDTGKKMLGISEEDVTQTNIMNVIPEHLLDKVRQEVLPSIAEYGFWEGDLQYINLKTGGLTDVHAITYNIADPKSNVMQFMANVSIDITERKRAEEALSKSEEKYRTIIENMEDGYHEVDLKGNFTFFNESMLNILGYEREDLLGMNNRQYADEENTRKVYQVYNQVYRTGEPVKNFEWQIIRKDGDRRDIEVSISLIRNTEGHPIGFRGIVRDTTDRKRADKALRKSEEQYQTLVENANEAILVIQDGMVKFVNSKASESFGYTEQELLSTPIFELIHPEDRDAVIERYRQKIHGDMRPTLNTYRTIHKSGKTQWIEISSVKIEWEGRPATLNLVTNITERVRAEEEKRSLLQRLNRAEKMESLGILAGGVAHDLNNVLGIVVGYAEMLLMGTDKSSPIRSKVVNIMEGGQKAATIVGDLLTLARRGVSGREVVNLNKIIADWQQSPEFEKLSSYNSAVKIKTELEPGLPNISASSVHLNKTIFNLVSNASEAMKKGGCVTIKTINQYVDKPIYGYDKIQEGDYVVLSVSDTGEGIHADDMKRIFEPFYTKKVMGRSGTGLGLAVVWGTVKDHNGYINVESEEGKGSTFTLYFPVTREELSAEHVAVSISEYMGKGESILVVDDVKGQRDLAEEMLQKLNYSVTSASSGEKALAYLKEHKVDLMVLDMIMDPGMDGLDTYRSVLEIDPKQKAIIVSGFSESDRVKTAQALGAGAYVRKPYVIEKLGLAVKKELDRLA